MTQDSITSLCLGFLLGQEGVLTVSAAEGRHSGQTRELVCVTWVPRECSGRGAAWVLCGHPAGAALHSAHLPLCHWRPQLRLASPGALHPQECPDAASPTLSLAELRTACGDSELAAEFANAIRR